MSSPAPGDFEIDAAEGVRLAGDQRGEGAAIVLLHGLSATRRYVVMGSRVLERAGCRVIAYDARGHGRSSPPSSSAHPSYTYELLVEDLRVVLDRLRVERAVIAGASMGAQTALRFALEHPERVNALALITPAFDPDASGDYEGWDKLARGLREGGVEGFVAAYDLDRLAPGWRDTVEKALRQRLVLHDHPLAVADALEAIPRSRPFEAWSDLERIAAPTLVVASRDEADPGHPLAVARRYAGTIAGARLVVEDPGPPPRSPLAWQGGQLSKLLVEIVALASE